MLTIRLFGEFQCLYQGQPLRALYAPRRRALLAYLLLHRAAPISRQQLALHFWPAAGAGQARNNLRNLLTHLCAALPTADHYLQRDPYTLQWRADAPYTLDVAEFEQALTAAQQANDEGQARHHLEQGLQQYQADLLPRCAEAWLLPIRAGLRNRYLQGLADLSELLHRQHEPRAALDQAQRLCQLDPLRESTYTSLMQLHLALGERGAALRVYHGCTTTLRRELGVAPSATTRVLYERLLNLESEELPPVPLPVLTTLIGRAAAWAQVQATWQQASRGRPQLLLIQGEAGIGKSHLAAALVAWVKRQGAATVSAHCYSGAGQLALAPILAWLRTGYFQPAIAALDAAQRVELARLMPEVVDGSALPLLPAPGRDAWPRQPLFALLARLTLWPAQPLLLVLDDLHWSDAETLEWLHFLLRFQPQARLLLVGTVRSEELTSTQPLTRLLHQLRRTDALVELALEPLSSPSTAALAAALTGQPRSQIAATALFAQTAGNPLLIVETIRAQLNPTSAGTSNRPATVPPTVHALMQSRFLRLSAAARELIDVAAVIGQSFTLAVFALASEQGEDALLLGLDELWQNQIVQTQAVAAYAFSHDTLREAALTAISPAWRRLLHQRVARALATVYSQQLDEVSGELAHHYAASNHFAAAISYYQRAAQVAQRRAARADAIAYLQRALQLVIRLPDPAVGSQIELALQDALAPLLADR